MCGMQQVLVKNSAYLTRTNWQVMLNWLHLGISKWRRQSNFSACLTKTRICALYTHTQNVVQDWLDLVHIDEKNPSPPMHIYSIEEGQAQLADTSPPTSGNPPLPELEASITFRGVRVSLEWVSCTWCDYYLTHLRLPHCRQFKRGLKATLSQVMCRHTEYVLLASDHTIHTSLQMSMDGAPFRDHRLRVGVTPVHFDDQSSDAVCPLFEVEGKPPNSQHNPCLNAPSPEPLEEE